MTGKVLMVQGTASHVGKSILVAALCRIFKNAGLKVAPFKAQNMSLNSYVTPDGGEIGRAQAVQADAAGIPPSVDMNPILLKPEANSRSQVVIMGRPELTANAADYYQLKPRLWPIVTGALDRLRYAYEIVVIEGAGSPAEINFASEEIVNMSIARYCQSPVLLVGDIDRGGVFASLLGTLWLLDPGDLPLVKATVINKFRGDRTLLEPGIRFLETKSGIPVAGVIPYFRDIHITQEDSVALDNLKSKKSSQTLEIAVVRLPHISNFDDFEPLEQEPGVAVHYVNSLNDLNQPHLIIIPGSKTTIADLDWLKKGGLASRIIELYQQGAFVIGICGGYQMLGEAIEDPEHIESPVTHERGLGLLRVTTTFMPEKDTHQIKGKVLSGSGLLSHAAGLPVEGYEIHMGRTSLPAERVFSILERSGNPCREYEGCQDASGRVMGTYIHGLFLNRKLRRAILKNIAGANSCAIIFSGNDLSRDEEYDKLANLVSSNLDMKLINKIAGLVG